MGGIGTNYPNKKEIHRATLLVFSTYFHLSLFFPITCFLHRLLLLYYLRFFLIFFIFFIVCIVRSPSGECAHVSHLKFSLINFVLLTILEIEGHSNFRGYSCPFLSCEEKISAIMAFAAFSLISPIHPSSMRIPVNTDQQPTNRAWSHPTGGINVSGSNGIDANDLVSRMPLRDQLEMLQRRQRELLVELSNLKRDQLDQHMYARIHLNLTFRLCTQLERVLEGKDSDSRSLEVLQTISRDVLKALEQYHAPGTDDPLRFLKQRIMQNATFEDGEINCVGNSSGPSTTAEGDQCKFVQS